MIPSIYSIDKESFFELFPTLPRYRFDQIEKWRAQGALSFKEYKNLDRQSIELLEKNAKVFSLKVVEENSDTNSTKVLLETQDGLFIECVYMTDSQGLHTACLSSQVGCACGCKFCATGTLGFTRNLEGYEIIEQYHHLKRLFGRVEKIVFMGMGEPLLNIDAVVGAIKYFKACEKISARRITISTVGIGEGIRKIADAALGIKLTLSLVTANQAEREKIMPMAKKNTLAVLKEALLYFQKHDNRRITLAYCMLKGVNMAEKNAKELSLFSKGLVSHVNLIPWNEVSTLDFKSPSSDDIAKFRFYLDKEHINYSIRYSKGTKIDAACGQLVAKKSQKLYNNAKNDRS